MDPILATIDKALRERGLTDAAASRLAVGHPSLVKNLRLARDQDKRYNIHALERLAQVLGLELYFGPPREAPPTAPVPAGMGEDWALLPVLAAGLAAAPGCEGREVGDGPEGHLALRRDWLRTLGVAPGNARLARIEDDSMRPLLNPGDLVLFDAADTAVREHPVEARGGPAVYAFRHHGRLMVRHLAPSGAAPAFPFVVVALDLRWLPQPVPAGEIADGTFAVLGRVRWLSRTLP